MIITFDALKDLLYSKYRQHDRNCLNTFFRLLEREYEINAFDALTYGIPASSQHLTLTTKYAINEGSVLIYFYERFSDDQVYIRAFMNISAQSVCIDVTNNVRCHRMGEPNDSYTD